MHFYILHYINLTIYSRNYNFSFHLQNSNYWLSLTISCLLPQVHSIPRRSRQKWKGFRNKVNYTFQHYGTVKHFSKSLKIIQGHYCYIGSPGYHFNILDELPCWILLKEILPPTPQKVSGPPSCECLSYQIALLPPAATWVLDPIT